MRGYRAIDKEILLIQSRSDEERLLTANGYIETKEEILSEFLNNFEGARGNSDGIVTWEEFYDYYSDLSMSTPSDEYFVKMMESTW